MKKVLVTGATGFIGSQSLQLLVAQGYEVHAVSAKPHTKLSERIHWHQADLLTPSQTAALLAQVQPTHLLHYAWEVTPGKFWQAPQNLQWVSASLTLLQSFAAHGGRRVVMAGTCAEYDWRYGYCLEQHTPLIPQTLYGASKHALQQMLSAFSQITGLSAAWGRIFHLYGVHEPISRLAPSVIVALLQGRTAPCTHGDQIRDFLYVEDAAAAFVSLLESEAIGPVNIASGQPVRLKELILAIAGKLGRTELIEFGALTPPAAEPSVLLADTTRLNKEVGWTPSYNLEQGLTHTITWWKSQLAS